MELSGLELRNLVRKLNDTLPGYYIHNIYSADRRVVIIRLHHSEKPEQTLILQPGKGLWLSRYQLKCEDMDSFTSALRHRLERAKVLRFDQPGVERVVFIKLELSDKSFTVVGEFFGEGNIVLFDGNEKILLVQQPVRVRHRTLLAGRKYILPPSRGIDPFAVTLEDIKAIRTSSLEVERWLGRNLAVAKKHVEEVVATSGLQRGVKGVDLAPSQIDPLYRALQAVIEKTTSGGEVAYVVLEGEHPVEAIPCPMKTYEDRIVKRTGSFMEAVDEVLSEHLVSTREEKAMMPLTKRLEELKRALAEQGVAQSSLEEKADLLRRAAIQIEHRCSLEGFSGEESPLDVLLALGGAREEEVGVRFADILFQRKEDASPYSLASKLFTEAKRLERKIDAIEAASRLLTKERLELEKMIETKKKIDGDVLLKPKRVPTWFERYRWFYTSTGRLAVGGRDVSSNVAVVKRHLENYDFVFHADLHGSPFFILKGGVDEASIREVAQAVVSYSSAWKEGFSSADAYWVNPGQVSDRAPSGTYLPKGSFMIRGEKNFVKSVSVQASVGLLVRDEWLVVGGGPPTAMKMHSLAFVTLVPERVKASDTAKAVKASLFKHVDPEQSKVLKRIPLDDFLRTLPPGGGKIVSVQNGEQKC